MPRFLSSMNSSRMNCAAFSLYSCGTIKFSSDIMILNPNDVTPYLSTNSNIAFVSLIVSSLNVTDNDTSTPIRLHISNVLRILLNTLFPATSTRILFASSVNPSTEIAIDTPSSLSFNARSSVSNSPFETMESSIFFTHFSFSLNELIFSAIYTKTS